MIYQQSMTAVAVFFLIVGATLWLSFYLGNQAKSSQGFFAAGGSIHWFVNGIAFAGDYLSAASFLGICGMIAFYGYDGFLYSIGYLAGWIVALLVVAEPLKRMGRYTFADALDSKFHSRGIKLTVAISTLVVSIFYLIPQMVGAGVLIKPLLGFAHYQGVILVGAIVTLIVVTAGMVSTTYVQFLKGTLLVVFSSILTLMILNRGLKVAEPAAGIQAQQTLELQADGSKLVNGKPQGTKEGQTDFWPVGHVSKLPDGQTATGPLGPVAFLRTIQNSEIVLWPSETKPTKTGGKITTYTPKVTPGSEILRPGNLPAFKGIRSEKTFDKLNFVSLMMALFGGTASLPHILIRYYTVKDQAAARKSTIVGIASIGFFYVLTLYIGLGAMTSGALDVTNTNMAAPLLARSFNEWLFAIISAIAFTTVLGTVSGLIIAAAGAVVHDLLTSVLKLEFADHAKVRIAKIASVVVGAIAIVLGIVFEKMNVSYLVGWAFSIAASANLPSLVMLLFWKKTTKEGIIAAVSVGMVSSLGWILLSGDTYKDVYGLPATDAIVPFSQPGIVTIPLGFTVLFVVSLLTHRRAAMTHSLRTLIVVATYNEIGNLPRLVVGLRQFAPEADILVIDDNSPDGTGDWCEEQASSDARFRVIHRQGKLGLGTATIAGLRFAIDNDYDLVVTMDADFSHDPQHLPDILQAATDSVSPVDVVIGSRYVAGGGIVGWPLRRRLMSRCINWYARLMLQLQPHDCSGAYRCFRVEILRSIDFAAVRSHGYSFLEELLWMVQRRGGRMREVPITYVERTHGKSKINLKEAWLAVWIIFRLGLQR